MFCYRIFPLQLRFFQSFKFGSSWSLYHKALCRMGPSLLWHPWRRSFSCEQHKLLLKCTLESYSWNHTAEINISQITVLFSTEAIHTIPKEVLGSTKSHNSGVIHMLNVSRGGGNGKLVWKKFSLTNFLAICSWVHSKINGLLRWRHNKVIPSSYSVMGCKRPSRDFIHHNNIKSYFFAQVKGTNVQDFDY